MSGVAVEFYRRIKCIFNEASHLYSGYWWVVIGNKTCCVIIESSLIRRWCTRHHIGLMRPLWSLDPWRFLQPHSLFNQFDLTSLLTWNWLNFKLSCRGVCIFSVLYVPHLYIWQIYCQSQRPESAHSSGSCTESSTQCSPGKSVYIHHKGPISFCPLETLALNRTKVEQMWRASSRWLDFFPVLCAQNPNSRHLDGLSKQLDWEVRKVQRWFRHRRNQDKPSTHTKFCESM